ncbi:hypothetical protein SteCoe_22525 [Stentor coeruleus]|uniref:Uncharacterized protein n=1 Tax=Stentor coeruleus TaxID=5963 RepID=A0A1R2BM75_9CILI|nr:hypothetical protein SteCoe_22525 [Stentor coeruleus]
MGSCISKTKAEEFTTVEPEVITIQRPKIRTLNLPVVIPRGQPKNRLRLFVVREASQEDTIRSPMVQ